MTKKEKAYHDMGQIFYKMLNGSFGDEKMYLLYKIMEAYHKDGPYNVLLQSHDGFSCDQIQIHRIDEPTCGILIDHHKIKDLSHRTLMVFSHFDVFDIFKQSFLYI